VPFKELDVANNNINPVDFEIEKNNLIQAIEKFSIADFLIPVHKAAGKFSKGDWGRLAYNHTNHHLRQFGV
jgi:hypothetical protein